MQGICWSVFPIELKADFCPFLGYWASKNTSLDYCLKGEFVSLAKPIGLCAIVKGILSR